MQVGVAQSHERKLPVYWPNDIRAVHENINILHWARADVCGISHKRHQEKHQIATK